MWAATTSNPWTAGEPSSAFQVLACRYWNMAVATGGMVCRSTESCTIWFLVLFWSFVANIIKILDPFPFRKYHCNLRLHESGSRHFGVSYHQSNAAACIWESLQPLGSKEDFPLRVTRQDGPCSWLMVPPCLGPLCIECFDPAFGLRTNQLHQLHSKLHPKLSGTEPGTAHVVWGAVHSVTISWCCGTQNGAGGRCDRANWTTHRGTLGKGCRNISDWWSTRCLKG